MARATVIVAAAKGPASRKFFIVSSALAPASPAMLAALQVACKKFHLTKFLATLLMCQRASTMSSEVHENSTSEISCTVSERRHDLTYDAE